MKYKKGDVLIDKDGKTLVKIHAAVDGCYLISATSHKEDMLDNICGGWWLESVLDEVGCTLKPKECEHNQRENLRDRWGQLICAKDGYVDHCAGCNSIYLNSHWIRIEK